MAAGSQNPLRQAMINMMYLVLLALLALNVSAQVLKAFETVHEGIEQSNSSLTQKNESTMDNFEDLLENNEERTLPHFKRAQRAQAISERLVEHIDTLKKEIAKKSGGFLKSGMDSGTLVGAKNLDVGTRILVEKGKGDTLQNMINNTRDKLVGILEEYNRDTALPNIPNLNKLKGQLPLKAEDPPKGPNTKKSWAAQNFEMVPVTAAVTLLSKIQSDVKNTESQILSTLIDQVGKNEISFDQFEVIIDAKKSAVSVGEKYEAEIMLGAYSSTQQPTITVGGQKVDVKRGKGQFSDVPQSPGEKSIPVEIKVENATTGETETHTKKLQYSAFKSPAIISADKMNVFYTGLENPVSVSVPGYRPSQVNASMTKGSLKKVKAGKYIATVPQARNTEIRVSVSMDDGTTSSVGSKEFRIKPVPKPTPLFGGKASGTISPGNVKVVNAVVASMGQSFAFEGVKYVVSHFRLTYVPKRGNFKEAENNGPRITREMKNILKNASPGDRIIIDDIEAKGPDGVKKLPTAITLKVE